MKQSLMVTGRISPHLKQILKMQAAVLSIPQGHSAFCQRNSLCLVLQAGITKTQPHYRDTQLLSRQFLLSFINASDQKVSHVWKNMN